MTPTKIVTSLLGLGILVWLLSMLDAAALGRALRDLDLVVLGGVILVAQLNHVVRAWRWKVLLGKGCDLSLRQVYAAHIVGSAANYVLPLRTGELVRAAALQRLGGGSFSASVGSVVAERLLDVAWLLGAALLALALFPLADVAVALGELRITASSESWLDAVFLLGAFLGGFAILGVLLWWALRGRGAAQTDAAAWPRLREAGGQFARGLGSLGNARSLVLSVAATLLIWGIAQANALLLMHGYPLGTEPTAGKAFLLLACVALGMALPNAPGNLGSLHLAIVLGLLFGTPGLDVQQAIGFAIVYHLAGFVPTVLVGYLFVWLDDLHILPRGSAG